MVTTEAGTAAAILGVLILPLVPTLVLLPILGVMLNGTSSVLYGTVPSAAAAAPACKTALDSALVRTGNSA